MLPPRKKIRPPAGALVALSMLLFYISCFLKEEREYWQQREREREREKEGKTAQVLFNIIYG